MCVTSPRIESDSLKLVNILRRLGEEMSVEEAAKKVFDETLTRFERDTSMVFTTQGDREALADMIGEWRLNCGYTAWFWKVIWV